MIIDDVRHLQCEVFDSCFTKAKSIRLYKMTSIINALKSAIKLYADLSAKIKCFTCTVRYTIFLLIKSFVKNMKSHWRKWVSRHNHVIAK